MIALGHVNYLNMAKVLAASIKANEPDLEICLVTDRMVEVEWQSLFDSYVQPDEKAYTTGEQPAFIKAKLYMYDFSPFTETVFLDVDQIVLEGRKLSAVFDQLRDVDLTLSNTGEGKGSVWADIGEVKKIYGNKPFWNFHSEFVYFKKGKTAATFFLVAKRVYDEKKVKSATPFAGGAMADELAFQCAAIITGIYPHQANWLPNFWYSRHFELRHCYPYQLKELYYTYSIGGPRLPAHIKENYNNLAAFYFRKLGLQNPYQARDKRSFLPERSKI